MTVGVNIGGVPQTAFPVVLSNSEGDVFAPSSGGNPLVNVISILVVNTDGSARKVQLYVSDGTTSREFWEQSVAANSAVQVDMLLSLVPGATNGNSVPKKIRGVAAAANVVHVTVSYTTMLAQKNVA